MSHPSLNVTVFYIRFYVLFLVIDELSPTRWTLSVHWEQSWHFI